MFAHKCVNTHTYEKGNKFEGKTWEEWKEGYKKYQLGQKEGRNDEIIS